MDNASGIAAHARDRRRSCTNQARSRRARCCSSPSPARRRASSARAISPRIPRCRAPRMVANVNTDMFLPLFPLKTLMVLGLDESDLGGDIRAVAQDARLGGAGGSRAAAQPLHPQRSVQLHPRRHAGAGDEGRLRAETRRRPRSRRSGRRERYHAPSDDLTQPVDRAAADKYVQVIRTLALRIANRPARPAWNAASFFKRFAK